MSSKEFEINGKTYVSLRLLGTGATSKVYGCLDEDSTIVAVKSIDLEGRLDRYRQNVMRELQIMKKLQPTGKVIKYIDSVEKDDHLYIVMEKGDTDLAKYFEREKIDRVKRQFYWQEMLTAVKTLHDNKIIHKDLKPGNFILVEGSLKLIDFGLAKSLTDGREDMYVSSVGAGTLEFISPEALGGNSEKAKAKISPRSDVWSLGCMLYYMTYGKTPFADVEHFQKTTAILNEKFAIKVPVNDEKDILVFDVIKKCLNRDASERPTVDELLEHPYLNPNSPMTNFKQVLKALKTKDPREETSKNKSDVKIGVKERTTAGPRRKVGHPMIIDIDRRIAGPGTMGVSCISPSKLSPSSFCEMDSKGDGKVVLTITPKEEGLHTLVIEFNDKQISGSPWRFQIDQPDNNVGTAKRN